MITKNYSPKHSALASLRFDSQCFNCGFDATIYLELDHYVAKSKGGKNSDFVLLCSRCNKAKSKSDALEFYGEQSIIDELEYRLSLEFSENEVMTELSRLVKIELDYANRTKAKNQKLSTAAKRASEMKGIQ